jgi:hypothetical protein
MSKFLTNLDVRLISDRHSGKWVLLSPLVYSSKVAGREFVVPTGFGTDFASVPRVPIIFDLMGDTAHSAAVIHDYLYSTGEVGRDIADSVFCEAALVSGVFRWRAYAMYMAVRASGKSHYSPPIGGIGAVNSRS